MGLGSGSSVASFTIRESGEKLGAEFGQIAGLVMIVLALVLSGCLGDTRER